MADLIDFIGIVKHMVNVEIGYFGDTFGRPTPDERVSEDELEVDPQADWYATEHESCDGLVDLYRRVWTFADETIEGLPLDAVGRVPWWPSDSEPHLGGPADRTDRSLLVHAEQPGDLPGEEVSNRGGPVAALLLTQVGGSALPSECDAFDDLAR